MHPRWGYPSPVRRALEAPLSTNPDARFWDREARKYAASPIEDPGGYERTLARVGPLLTPQDRVLELGCGTGSTALRLAPLVGAYLATDLSSEMITIAREKLAREPVPGLRFEVASAEGDPAEAPFDAVLAFNLLHLVPDLDAALASVSAKLRPGGRFLSKTACITELNVFIRTALPVMRWVGKAPSHVRVFDEATLLRAIQRAGFEVDAVERHGTTAKDVRAFVSARKPG
jgi:SAM-dependent methyltransferase